MAKCARFVGALALALGIGAATMTHPGIVTADPTAEPSPGSSTVEDPDRGGSDSTTEPGVVSSGGSTPPAGTGSADAGSGSGAASGPDQVAESSTSTGSAGSTEATSQPAPGVIIRSSGGALTSSESSQTAEATSAETAKSTPEPVVAVVAPTEAQSAVPAAATAAAGAPPVAQPASTTLGPVERPAKHLVVPRIYEIPARTPVTRMPTAQPPMGVAVITSEAPDPAVAVKTVALPQTSDALPLTTTSDAEASLRLFTGALAAALAPFLTPLPGTPAEQPTLWAVLAWARRQFERNSGEDRPDLLIMAQQTECVVADGEAPGAVVDRVDPVTGRVSGRINLGDDDGSGLTFTLVAQVDRRLGIVTVDGTTGDWTFTPNQLSRLAAQLTEDGGVVAFAVAASDGRTVDIRAPVDPAEAAVTDSIEVGDGLTYGLAVAGDRLYVLNASVDAAGNGVVKVVDTVTKRVIGSVEVGSMPFALAVRGRSLYVGNADDGTVSVIDLVSHRVVHVIDVGAHPYGLEILGDRLYVADHAGTVSVIDLDDNSEIARIPVDGDPFGVAATADRVYVTDYAGDTVAVVDNATNTAVGQFPVAAAGFPYYAAVVGGRLYVVNVVTNALTIVDRSMSTVVDVDPTTRAVDAVPGGAAPADLVVRGDRLYVGNVNSGTVTVLDASTNQPVATIRVGIAPGIMTATPDGRTIYVADVMAGTVRVISSVRHAAG